MRTNKQKGGRSMEALTVNNYSLKANNFNMLWVNDFISSDQSEKTVKTYITNLRQFIAYLSYKAIKNPVENDIKEYKIYLKKPHEAIKLNRDGSWSYRRDKSGNKIIIECKPATIKLYLQSVKQFFKFLASKSLYPNIAENIKSPKVRQDNHKKEALEASDVLKIEQSIKENAEKKKAAAKSSEKDKAGKIERATEQGKRLFAMYLLAVNAGLRTVEIQRAKIENLETIKGVTYLYIHGKGHSEADQKKALAPEVVNAINDYLDARTDAKRADSPLFVATGNRSKGKELATTTISTMLKQAMQQAGYNSPRLTAHSLRHTAGNNVMEITDDNIYITQQYMRHVSPKTTEIYLHRNTEKKDAEIANKLYNYYHNSDKEEICTATETNNNDNINMNTFTDGLTQAQINELLSMADKMRQQAG